MAALSGNTIASTFSELLRLGNSTLSASAGTSHYIKDAADTNSALSINTARVGIGTATPGSNLHIVGTAVGADTIASNGITIENTSGSITSEVGIRYSNHDTGSNYWMHGLNQNDDFQLAYGTTFVTANVKMTVESGGNVGIGTIAPASTQGYGHALEVVDGDSGTSKDAALVLGSWNGSAAENKWEIGNNTSGKLEFSHSLAADGSTGTKVVIDASGNVGIGKTAPSALLHVNDATLATTESALIKITGTGNSVENEAAIGVIYEDSSDTNAPTAFIRLDASDGAAAYYFQGDDGKLYVTTNPLLIGIDGSATIVAGEDSDERLKDIDTNAFPYGLLEVNKLSPIKYTYKNDKKKISHIGFGAQTTQPIIPESVTITGECPDGYDKETGEPNSDRKNKMGMQYVEIIPVLVKAVQELSAKVTALENA